MARIKSDDASNRRKIVFLARFRLRVTWVLLAATSLLGGAVSAGPRGAPIGLSSVRAAGLGVDRGSSPAVRCSPRGGTRAGRSSSSSRTTSDRIVAHGLITEAEFADASAAVARHLDDPTTLVVSTVVFQAWGRKPGQ